MYTFNRNNEIVSGQTDQPHHAHYRTWFYNVIQVGLMVRLDFEYCCILIQYRVSVDFCMHWLVSSYSNAASAEVSLGNYKHD